MDDADLPTVQTSAGALIYDPAGRLLILKPTYKSGWTLPGGMMEADGETPWEACQREVREECGIEVRTGRLACVDFRPRRPERPGRPERQAGIRFLFDCGTVSEEVLVSVRLQPDEIADCQLAEPDIALALLRKRIRRRVSAVWDHPGFIYLENGYPVPAVG